MIVNVDSSMDDELQEYSGPHGGGERGTNGKKINLSENEQNSVVRRLMGPTDVNDPSNTEMGNATTEKSF